MYSLMTPGEEIFPRLITCAGVLTIAVLPRVLTVM